MTPGALGAWSGLDGSRRGRGREYAPGRENSMRGPGCAHGPSPRPPAGVTSTSGPSGDCCLLARRRGPRSPGPGRGGHPHPSAGDLLPKDLTLGPAGAPLQGPPAVRRGPVRPTKQLELPRVPGWPGDVRICGRPDPTNATPGFLKGPRLRVRGFSLRPERRGDLPDAEGVAPSGVHPPGVRPPGSLPPRSRPHRSVPPRSVPPGSLPPHEGLPRTAVPARLPPRGALNPWRSSRRKPAPRTDPLPVPPPPGAPPPPP